MYGADWIRSRPTSESPANFGQAGSAHPGARAPAGGRNNAACPTIPAYAEVLYPQECSGPRQVAPARSLPPHGRWGRVTFEIEIPDDWPPSLGFAVTAMIRQSLKDGFPIVVPVRRDTTPDQLEAAFDIVRSDILRAGLAA